MDGETWSGSPIIRPKSKAALIESVQQLAIDGTERVLGAHGASPDLEDSGGVSAALRASRKRDERFLAALKS